MQSERTQQVEKTSEFTHGVNSDKEIAKPSGECCLKGTIHEGNPRGSTTTISGVETYVVEPPKDKNNGHVLLYFPDVFGFFTNGFLIMDGFADAGYLTLGMDYFRGVWGVQNDNRRMLKRSTGSSMETPQASKRYNHGTEFRL
jgi:hypothetical protein